MKHYFEDATKVIAEQNSDVKGLSVTEAAKRLEVHGHNKLAEGKKTSLIVKFLLQLKDPMILILMAAAVLSGVFGEIADMSIILFVVVLNAILGIFQEGKAEKAIEALQQMSAPYSKVRRNGVVEQIKSEEIVPGDIVLLEAGDAIPADIRLITTASLKVEEAALTGESVASEKFAETIPSSDEDVPLGDRSNMVYLGTSAVYGRAEGIVVATGMQTEMGKIASMLAGADEDRTPLQKKLDSLGKVLSIAVIVISIFVFFFGVLKHGGFSGGHVFDSLLIAISLAVAAIPEGLVVVVTVLLSIGVTKMSKRNAIIRRLTAVETLGCTQVICSDKTGTLTQNKMTVTDHFGDEQLLATAMAFCNDVSINPEGEFIGEPTEIGLVAYAKSLGLEKSALEQTSPRVGEAPFDSVRKMMSTIHQSDGKQCVQYTKGAPDEILKNCQSILINGEKQPLTQQHRDQILAENKRMADRALRVLAAATRNYDQKPENLEPAVLETDMTFVGLAGMIDPVRPEVKAAIEECQTAGIRPIMITGDHKDTAVAIAKELGILTNESQAITGADLAAMDDKTFNQRIESISVYARVQPEHKVRIVNTWRKKGKIAAMTGDGVNDAPALKNADIGVGMGITGTDVTKNVADLVLADDNFATIVYAVEEGRRIYENIRKVIQFLLSANLSEVVSIFIATLVGWELFAPIHLLWINLVTDTAPAMALGMEEAEADSMSKPPRDAREGIFANGLGVQTVYQGIIIAGLTLLAFYIGEVQQHTTGMTMAFLTLSMCEIFHSWNLRSRSKSIFAMPKRNKFILGASIVAFVLTLGVIYIPGINDVFRLQPLSIGNLLMGSAIAISIVPIVEVVKAISRNRAK